MQPDDALPDRPEAITPAWLSAALAHSIPSVEVSAVEVVDRHSGTTGRARLRLRYAPGPSGPETLFVKLPPFEEAQRRLVAATDMGRREARFYAELAAEVPLRVPRCHFAAHGEAPTDYLMLLEDLEASGCGFVRADGTDAAERGAKLVVALARLHAHFWGDARFDCTLAWVPPAMRGALGAKLVDRARERFAAGLPPVFAELCRLYVAHHERICDLWDEGPATLIHGDCHAGNQFVDGERIGLFDWAVISRSPGIRDLGVFLANSCPPELRRAEGEAWLSAYHETLVEAGVDAPEPSELWRRLRLAALYGWVAAATTAAAGDRWQPLEVGVRATRDATRACAELGTLEAFREAL